MKYKILFDYRTEGYAFYDAEFDSVDDAVKEALASNYSVPFLIVQVIPWTAQPTEPHA